MALDQPDTCFLDLCKAGAPLAATAHALQASSHPPDGSCDLVHLAHAVGKDYRDAMLAEIVEPHLRLDLAGRSTADCRAAVRLLQRLQGTQAVRFRCRSTDDESGQSGEHHFFDPEGLQQLRLLPKLAALNLSFGPHPTVPPVECLKAVSGLQTLRSLDVNYFFDEKGHSDAHTREWAQQACQHIGVLSSLTQLHASLFRLERDGLEHLASRLHGLVELQVSANDLQGADFSGFSNLTMLQAVSAGIDEATMRSISTLTALRHLEIPETEEGLDAHCAMQLSSLVALTSLDLGYNYIGPGWTGTLTCLTRLETLDIGGNDLDGASLASLAKLPTLQELRCSGNELGPEGALHIAKCPNLVLLSVGGVGLGGVGAAHLSCLTNLQKLFIDSNGLGPKGAAVVSRLPSLQVLHIADNALGLAGAQHIARMNQLTYLDIQSNGLGVQGVCCLVALTNLADIVFRKYFDDPEFTVDAEVQLRRAVFPCLPYYQIGS